MNRTLSHLSRVAAAVLAIGAAASSHAAICNNVVFSFTNISSGPILVSRVDYRDLNSSDPNRRWVENVSDFSCPAGQPCETAPQDLGGTTRPRENHDLTSIRFEHAHQDEFGNWRDPVWSSSNTPADMTCTDGRTYGRYNVN
jgi:hypothetical protein